MLSKKQEEGLLKYRQIEAEMRYLDDKILAYGEVGENTSSLVLKYNKLTVVLNDLVKNYELK